MVYVVHIYTLLLIFVCWCIFINIFLYRKQRVLVKGHTGQGEYKKTVSKIPADSG